MSSVRLRAVVGADLPVHQRLVADPAKIAVFAPFNLTLPPPANKHRHQQVELIIGVTGKGKRSQTGFSHVYAQFFLQLANKRGFRLFSRFHLATGKLPQSGQVFTFGALRNQDTTIPINQRTGNDENELFSVHVCKPPWREKVNRDVWTLQVEPRLAPVCADTVTKFTPLHQLRYEPLISM